MAILHVVAAGIAAGAAWTAGSAGYEKHLSEKLHPYLGWVLLVGLGYVLLRARE